MYTLGRLLNLTHTKFIGDASAVRITSLDETQFGKDYLCIAHIKGKEESYRTIIQLRNSTKLALGKKAWVWCSCPHYTYTREYNNTRVGSSNIIRSNGKEPEHYPTSPGLCKHLVAIVDRILHNSK